MSKRVVITGMALASPLGSTVESAFERLHRFENCIEYDTVLDEYENLYTRLASKVQGFKHHESFNRKTTRTMGPVSVMAVTTAIEALTQAGLLDDPIIQNGKTGVSYGSSIGSLEALLDFYSMQV